MPFSAADRTEMIRRITGGPLAGFHLSDPSSLAYEVVAEIEGVLYGTSTVALSRDVQDWLDDHGFAYTDAAGMIKKIQLIKEVRSRFAIGLKEAKDEVDHWCTASGLR